MRLKISPTIAITAVLTAFLFQFAATASASGVGQRYKWKDSEGATHYSDTLAPEAAKFGYDLVDARGLVIRHVERLKTPEEQATEKAELAKIQASKQQIEDRIRADQQMLVAYPTEADLKRGQQQQLDMLDQNLNSTNVNQHNQEKALADLLSHAADFERSRTPIPATLMQDIAKLRKQLEEHHAYVAHKEDERKTMEAKFAADLAHYREIKAAAQPKPH